MSDLGVFGAHGGRGEATTWRRGPTARPRPMRRIGGGPSCGGMARRRWPQGAMAMRWHDGSHGRRRCRAAGNEPRRRWPPVPKANRRPAGGASRPAGPADRPHASSPTRPSGSATLDDRRRTARPRSSLDMPENLTTWRIKVWGMGHGTKVGQGADRRRHAQGPDRPPAGPAVLRAEGRGGAVGQRPQLPEDRRRTVKVRAGTATAKTTRSRLGRSSTGSTVDQIAGQRRGPRRLARQGRSTRARPSSA